MTLAFRIFHKFLLNKQGYKNNEAVKKRFKFTKPNLQRLGLEHYLGIIGWKDSDINVRIDDKENLTFAMEYCLFYLLENEYSFGKQLFDVKEKIGEKMYNGNN